MKRSRKILVVEDDLELSTVIDRVLQSIDPMITVDWVTSAEQAVALIKDKKAYDLIVTDIFLDGTKSGVDLWKLCQERLPRIPVIVTSALPVDRFFAILGKDSISPAYLPKPFQLTECQQMLEGMLRYAERSTA
jgi:CheY-like chemotaxis protein